MAIRTPRLPRVAGPATASLVCLAAAFPALAQAPSNPPVPGPAVGRAAENVVRQAEDAFGATIGRESLGIYSAGNVRGFSALAAGNARIDGLFFDQVAAPSPRIRRSTAIRVGLSALSFPFPAPTGVVDYALIKPQAEPGASATLAADGYGSASVELDLTHPLAAGRVIVAGGVGVFHNEFANGTSSRQLAAGLTAVVHPVPELRLQPFWSRTETYDNTIGPLYAPRGGVLPPDIPTRRFLGQPWAEFEGGALAYGLLARWRPRAGWAAEAGLFRSAFLTDRDTFVLLSDIDDGGVGQYRVFTDPPGKTASTSGEVRIVRTMVEGPRTHRLIASARGRDRWQLFGGSDEQDLGRVRVGDRIRVPEPAYAFGDQSRDDVRQWTLGLTYAVRWTGRGELSLGASKTDYRKTVDRPGIGSASTMSEPWLYNAAVAVELAPSLTAYAGYARGLEESGVAPQNATNRNEPLPAIRTSQRDAGIRWAANDRVRLIAGVFDLRKPYFSRDAAGLYTQLGDIRSRGVEASLSGSPLEGVRLVAGAALLWPEVTGEGVRLGRVGPRPVNLPKRRFDVSVDWATPVENLSLDARLSHRSRRPATTSNAVYLPARTTLDVGGRYRLQIRGAEATLRVSVSNVFDEGGFDLFGSGTYDIAQGRTLSVYLTADF